MALLPTFWIYCKNTQPINALAFDLSNGLTVYFSYKTPIAFRVDGKTTIRVNEWGPTTGKHLNAIDADKRLRVDGAIFEARLKDAVILSFFGGVL